MKTTIASILFASLAFAAVGAQAADVDHVKSRAEVVAELAQAKADGQYTFGESQYPAPITQTASLSRAQVESQLAAAKADGQVTFGNLAYPPKAVASVQSESRDQVQAELAQAKADGVYTFGNLDYPPVNG